MRKKTPRNYPETMPGPETGRPMTRGEKRVSFKIEGRQFFYLQPGWWCSLSDPGDMEGQLVDEDNQIADMARKTARAIVKGGTLFVPVVIRAIRERCGLTQREAGLLFGTGEKSFEKYESGEIAPSEPTKRLLRLAIQRPELFKPHATWSEVASPAEEISLIHKTLADAAVDGIYGSLFEAPEDGAARPTQR